jgi:hypothetical protein
MAFSRNSVKERKSNGFYNNGDGADRGLTERRNGSSHVGWAPKIEGCNERFVPLLVKEK